jgi:diguanylate cyclase (GGDEF)-like protein
VAIESARHYQQATVDSLTGCFLRDYFFKRLQEEHERCARYGGSFSLLMLDLDGFKEINDQHGHLAGDLYLGEISGTIRAQLRAADIACRYGGDEFCLLLPETDLTGARVIAERIRLAIADTVVAQDGVTLRSTASIGIAVYPRHGSGDALGLLRNADEALYRAKRSGRDCVVPFAA